TADSDNEEKSQTNNCNIVIDNKNSNCKHSCRYGHDHDCEHGCGCKCIHSYSLESSEHSELKKTGILPNSNSSTIKTAIKEQQNLENNNLEDLQQILKLETANSISGLAVYINDNKIVLTEEMLNDKQIIDFAIWSVELEDSLSNEELDLISHKERLNALTTFIDYFKQQTDVNFKIKDLNIFKKYNNIVRKKYLANMKQIL
ncbi:16742_t:CDS:2, partial [Cetraspora pellucida]